VKNDYETELEAWTLNGLEEPLKRDVHEPITDLEINHKINSSKIVDSLYTILNSIN
jgi:hypothetical protein